MKTNLKGINSRTAMVSGKEGTVSAKRHSPDAFVPMKWLKFCATNPCASFCIALWMYLLILLFVGAGVIVWGSDFFPFSTEVPLYLKYSTERVGCGVIQNLSSNLSELP